MKKIISVVLTTSFLLIAFRVGTIINHALPNRAFNSELKRTIRLSSELNIEVGGNVVQDSCGNIGLEPVSSFNGTTTFCTIPQYLGSKKVLGTYHTHLIISYPDYVSCASEQEKRELYAAAQQANMTVSWDSLFSKQYPSGLDWRTAASGYTLSLLLARKSQTEWLICAYRLDPDGKRIFKIVGCINVDKDSSIDLTELAAFLNTP